MTAAATVLSLILSALFLFTGGRKIVPSAAVAAEAQHLGLSANVYRLIGMAELVGGAGLIVGIFLPWAGIAAATGLALLMVGAAGAHLRRRDPLGRAVVPCVLALLTIAVSTLRLLS